MGQLKSRLYRGKVNLRKVDSKMITRSDDVDVAATMCEYNTVMMEELQLLQDCESISASQLFQCRRLRLELESRIDALEGRMGTHFRNSFSSFSPWKFDVRMPLEELGVRIEDRRKSIVKNTIIKKLQLPVEKGRMFTPVLIETKATSANDALRLFFATSDDATTRIEVSPQFGRIVGFDFNSHPTFHPSQMRRVPVWLMMHHICCLLAGSIVSGIPFMKVDIDSISRGEFCSPFRQFNQWLSLWYDSETHEMIAEFNRLTKIAFKIARSSTIVFILNGMIDSESWFQLLHELSVSPRIPLCIITGSDLGKLASGSRKVIIYFSRTLFRKKYCRSGLFVESLRSACRTAPVPKQPDRSHFTISAHASRIYSMCL